MPNENSVESTILLPDEKRRLIKLEILAVVSVTFLGPIAGAIHALTWRLSDHIDPPLFRRDIVTNQWADALSQSVIYLAAPAAVVLLMAFILHNGKKSWADIGIKFRRPILLFFLAISFVVALFVISFCAALLSSAVGLIGHYSGTSVRGVPKPYLTMYFFASLRAGILEEVIVVGYLTMRLQDLGWSRRQVVFASVLFRISFHIYGGFTLIVMAALFGFLFVSYFVRKRWLLPLIIGHVAYDFILLSLRTSHR